MVLEIHTRDLPLVFAFKRDTPPEGVSVFVPQPIQTRSADSGQVLSVIIHYGADVPVGILASWLYDRLKKGGIRNHNHKSTRDRNHRR